MGNSNSSPWAIAKIISQNYKPSSNELILCGYKQEWPIVLSKRNWSSLQKLTIACCQIKDENIHFISSMNWHNLKNLVLFTNKITSKGLEKLFQNKWPSLEFLSLNHNELKNEGMILLTRRKNLKIKRLALRKNHISSLPSLNYFDEFNNISSLCSLDLSENKIGPSGIKILIKLDLSKLQNLKLYKCHIGDQGAKFLGKSCWPQLKILWIDFNNIKMEGNIALCEAKWLKLQTLKFVQSMQFFTPIEAFYLTFCSPWLQNISVKQHISMNFLQDINQLFQRSK